MSCSLSRCFLLFLILSLETHLSAMGMQLNYEPRNCFMLLGAGLSTSCRSSVSKASLPPWSSSGAAVGEMQGLIPCGHALSWCREEGDRL